jgi:hypothetical protein
MVDYTNRVGFEVMRTFDSSTLSGSYQAIGSVLAYPSRMHVWVNNCANIITVSYDGTNAHLVLLPSSAFVLDFTSNAVSNAYLVVSQGTQPYVKGAASTGLIYLSCIYSQ